MTTLLVVCDSDSYLKWGVSRALDAPPDWDTEVVVVLNAVTPSESQVHAAVDGRIATPAQVAFPALVARLREAPPDILLLACRGPLIDTLAHEALTSAGGPVVVAGIPGLWFPPTELGLALRTSCDLMIVHSERERREVSSRLPQGRLERVGLASLHFDHRDLGRADRPRVVFAPQALVPQGRAQRLELLGALIATARRHPDIDVVIKLRGLPGEAQTHRERDGFDELLAGRPAPANLTLGYGPLRDYLGDCLGLVTVSSTAALEAAGSGVPVLCLTDFGVGVEQINLVFEGSGLQGTLDDLRALDFREPDAAWMADNYFHADRANDWIEVALELAAAPRPAWAPPGRSGPIAAARRMRRRWEALGAADTPPRRLIGRSAQAVARLRYLVERLLTARDDGARL